MMAGWRVLMSRHQSGAMLCDPRAEILAVLHDISLAPYSDDGNGLRAVSVLLFDSAVKQSL